MITLLLVDDEPWVRHGLRMWLEREADITVVGEASDGAEGIKLAQALQPDVVLMDISLPTMDGITAAAAIRAAVPHCAVVFLSLYDDAATRARADAAGAVAFVGKQEGVRALQAAIRQAGRLGRARRSILRGDRQTEPLQVCSA
jgi:DNA-binding NarL/FixJ family response regulator